MAAWLTSLWQKNEPTHPAASTLEARLRANWIVERLAAALGVAAADHPVTDTHEMPLRYIHYRDYYVDVYLEVERAGLAKATGAWVLIVSGEEGVVTRTFQGVDLLPAIDHIVRFSRSRKYRRCCLEQSPGPGPNGDARRA